MRNFPGVGVVCLVLLMLLAVGSPARAADRPLNILVYGNSFMAGPNVPGTLACLAVAAGKPKPNVVNAAVFSMDLAYHIANTTTVVINPYTKKPISPISQKTDQPTNFISDDSLNKSASGKWDYVVLQDVSTKPTDAKTFQGTIWGVPTKTSNSTSFKNDVQTLYGMVKADSPKVKLLLVETWAQYPGISPLATQPEGARYSVLNRLYPTLAGKKDAAGYLAASNQMQLEVKKYCGEAVEQVKSAFPDADAVVVPVGDAMKATGKPTFDPTYAGYDPSYWEVTAGYSHESSKGALLMALLLYRQIYADNDTYHHLPYAKTQPAMVGGRGAGLQNGNTGIVDQSTWGALTAYADSVPLSGVGSTSTSQPAAGEVAPLP